MEIGSDYHLDFCALEKTGNDLNSYMSGFDMVYLDSGRSAIRLLLDTLPDGDVLLPEYICDSVVEASAVRKISYYQIFEDFTINFDNLEEKISASTRIILIMHYFGVLQPRDQLLALRQKTDCLIIEDTTHSLFTQRLTVGDYGVCSLRKWFPVPDGGLIYAKTSLQRQGEQIKERNHGTDKINAMVLKNLFLENRLGSKDLALEIFRKAEETLWQDQTVRGISYLSEFLLAFTDINDLIERRIENFKHLSQGLRSLSVQVLNTAAVCPFTCVIFCQERDQLRRFLIE
ncbi:DegT/DnrJ/EryC1/StrS family aminotransferase [Eubacteriaceae bacterium ES2]|nr:DegT/DnrJ/EryC1/StrS family aminotransferase [Eubacteriaceae bacterium ES2]